MLAFISSRGYVAGGNTGLEARCRAGPRAARLIAVVSPGSCIFRDDACGVRTL